MTATPREAARADQSASGSRGLMPRQQAKEENGPGNREEAARYVAALSANLAAMARRHGLEMLGYILDMARLEAENHTGAETDG